MEEIVENPRESIAEELDVLLQEADTERGLEISRKICGMSFTQNWL